MKAVAWAVVTMIKFFFISTSTETYYMTFAEVVSELTM